MSYTRDQRSLPTVRGAHGRSLVGSGRAKRGRRDPRARLRFRPCRFRAAAPLRSRSPSRRRCSPAPAAPRPTPGPIARNVLCTLAPGQSKLPPERLRGLAHHLRQYPELSVATPAQRRAAARLLQRIRTATARWRRRSTLLPRQDSTPISRGAPRATGRWDTSMPSTGATATTAASSIRRGPSR